jgi:hypothetical protein
MTIEAEVHVLRSRVHERKLNKARRGELSTRVPIGYARTPEGGIALDPGRPGPAGRKQRRRKARRSHLSSSLSTSAACFS